MEKYEYYVCSLHLLLLQVPPERAEREADEPGAEGGLPGGAGGKGGRVTQLVNTKPNQRTKYLELLTLKT